MASGRSFWADRWFPHCFLLLGCSGRAQPLAGFSPLADHKAPRQPGLPAAFGHSQATARREPREVPPADAHPAPHSPRNSHVQAAPHCNSDAYPAPHTPPNVHAQAAPQRNFDSHAQAAPHRYSDAHPAPHGNCDSDAHPAPHLNCDSHAQAPTHRQSNSAPDPESYSTLHPHPSSCDQSHAASSRQPTPLHRRLLARGRGSAFPGCEGRRRGRHRRDGQKQL